MTFTITPIPSPAPTDLADGPAAFSASKTAIETNLAGAQADLNDLFNVKTGTPWDLKIGQTNSTTQRIITVQRQVGTDLWEMRMQVDTATDPFVFGTYKGGVKQSRFSLQPSGQLMIDAGGKWRPVPFAVQVLQDAVQVGGVSYATKTVDLDPGRFTHTPAMFVVTTSSIWMVGLASGNSATQAVVFARSYNNTNGGTGGSVGFWLLAIQMLPGATVG